MRCSVLMKQQCLRKARAAAFLQNRRLVHVEGRVGRKDFVVSLAYGGTKLEAVRLVVAGKRYWRRRLRSDRCRAPSLPTWFDYLRQRAPLPDWSEHPNSRP